MYGAFACAILGIGVYLKTELLEIKTDVKKKLDGIDKEIEERILKEQSPE